MLTQHVNADNGPPLIYIYIYINKESNHKLLTTIVYFHQLSKDDLRNSKINLNIISVL